MMPELLTSEILKQKVAHYNRRLANAPNAGHDHGITGGTITPARQSSPSVWLVGILRTYR